MNRPYLIIRQVREVPFCQRSHKTDIPVSERFSLPQQFFKLLRRVAGPDGDIGGLPVPVWFSRKVFAVAPGTMRLGQVSAIGNGSVTGVTILEKQLLCLLRPIHGAIGFLADTGYHHQAA